MDAANERDLTMREWKERYAALPETELSAPAAELIAEERRLRDAELAPDLSTEQADQSDGMT